MTDVFAIEENINDVACSDFIWEEWEEYKGDVPFWQHTFCGSIAGIMEHVCMYPLDTMKTYFQTNGAWNFKERRPNELNFYSYSDERIEKGRLNHFNEGNNNRLSKNTNYKLEKKYIYENSICKGCFNKPCNFRKEFLLHGKVCPNMSVNMLYRSHSNIPYLQKGYFRRITWYGNNSKRNENAVNITSKNVNMMHISSILKKRKKLKILQNKYPNGSNELKDLKKGGLLLQQNNRNTEKCANAPSKEKFNSSSRHAPSSFLTKNYQINKLERKMILLKNLNNKLKTLKKCQKKCIGKNSNGNLFCRRFCRNYKSMYLKEDIRDYFSNKQTKNIFFDRSLERLRNNNGFYQFDRVENSPKKFMYIENKYYSTELLKKIGNDGIRRMIDAEKNMIHCLRRTPFRNVLYKNKKPIHIDFLNRIYMKLNKSGNERILAYINNTNHMCSINHTHSMYNVNDPIDINAHDIKQLNKNCKVINSSSEGTNLFNITKKHHLKTFPFGNNRSDIFLKNFVTPFFNRGNEKMEDNRYILNFWKNNKNVLIQKFITLKKCEKKKQLVYKENTIKNAYNKCTNYRNIGGSNLFYKVPMFKDVLKRVLKKENIKSICGFSKHLKETRTMPRVAFNLETFHFFTRNVICGNNKIINEVAKNSITNSTLMKNNIFSLYKGVNVVILGCIPAHALYFSTFEYSKKYLLNANIENSFSYRNKKTSETSGSATIPKNGVTNNSNENSIVGQKDSHIPLFNTNNSKTPVFQMNEVNYMIIGISGLLATLVHDAIITPIDTLKQRIQLGISKGGLDTLKMVQANGVGSLYLSFPVTLLMNVPYQIIMICTNEKMKKIYFEYLCNRYYKNQNIADVKCANINTSVPVNIDEPIKKQLRKVNKSCTNVTQDEDEMDIMNKIKKETSQENGIMSWIHKTFQNTNSFSNCKKDKTENIEEPKNNVFFPEKDNETKMEKEKEQMSYYNTITALPNFEKEKYIDLKNMHLKKNNCFSKNTDHIISYFVCAGIGGGIAAVLTNPLDVIKTRIQTQYMNVKGFQFFRVVSNLYNKEGVTSFFKGSLARMTLCIPASAISWGSYETMKRFFKLQLNNN